MKNQKIICPFCGTEYLPGEIFLPKLFLGQPTNVERDIHGKIIWQEGVDQNLQETFCCVNCNKDFSIKADINFTVGIPKINAINSDYISSTKSDKITLAEN